MGHGADDRIFGAAHGRRGARGRLGQATNGLVAVLLLRVRGLDGREQALARHAARELQHALDEPDGADPTVSMLCEAPRYLRPDGRLVFPVISLSNEERILDMAQRLFAQLRLRTQQLFPIPRALHEALERVKQRLSRNALRLIPRGSRQCWQLRIFEARLTAERSQDFST